MVFELFVSIDKTILTTKTLGETGGDQEKSKKYCGEFSNKKRPPGYWEVFLKGVRGALDYLLFEKFQTLGWTVRKVEFTEINSRCEITRFQLVVFGIGL